MSPAGKAAVATDPGEACRLELAEALGCGPDSSWDALLDQVRQRSAAAEKVGEIAEILGTAPWQGPPR